jgi:anti-sigma28 factor (negative regulator of flagellin synthesis)
MAIDPLGSGNISESGQKRVSAVNPVDGKSAVNAVRAPSVDSVEVSEEARRLAEPEIPTGTIPAETLREISSRIADGSYNVDSVIDTIADKLRDQVF